MTHSILDKHFFNPLFLVIDISIELLIPKNPTSYTNAKPGVWNFFENLIN